MACNCVKIEPTGWFYSDESIGYESVCLHYDGSRVKDTRSDLEVIKTILMFSSAQLSMEC